MSRTDPRPPARWRSPSPTDPRPPARWRSPSPWQRVRDAVTGLAAVMALLAILGGVPVALARFVGWPLPTAVPTVDAVVAAVRYGQIAPGTLLKTLAVIVWITWSLVTAGVVVELAALVRGTVARPAVGGLQQFASRLLTAAMLLSTLTTRPAVAAETPAPVVTSVQEATPARADDTQHDVTWRVRRRDSLWTIAERTLGDGQRWREIRDLNVGRAQPDGGRLRADDTTIRPGWILRLPDDADTDDVSREITVERGDHLWGLAEEHLGDGARWRRLYEDNTQVRQPDGERLVEPGLIRPGWVLRLPDDTGTASGGGNGRPTPDRTTPRRAAPPDQPAREAPPDRPAGEAPVAPLPATPSTLPGALDRADGAASRTTQAASPRSEPAVIAASGNRSARDMRPVAGVALLAAGLIGVLAQRRRHWLRHRSAGSALAPVDPEVAELERWLRAMADHDVSHRTDRVLRLLTEHFDAHDVHPPVFALELGDHVSLLLSDAATSAPPGITVADDGRRWVLDPELEVAAPRLDDQPPLVPALVGCGRRPSGELVALHLLQLGVLELGGPEHLVQQALTSWTAELASRGATDGVELIVVGPHHHQVEQFARVTIAGDARAATTRVERVLTGADPEDVAPSHAVVLSAAPSDDDAWETLRERAVEDPRLALVVPGTGDAHHLLRLEGDRVHLHPPGLELLAPEWPTPETWDRVGDLLDQPVRQRHSELVPSPLLAAPLDRGLTGLTDWEDDAPTPSPVVRLLGPLRVDGVPVLEPAVADVIAYLACHRDAATSAMLRTQLDAGQQDDTLRTVIDATRAALGHDDAGAPLLTADADGRYRLAAGVGSDLGRFHQLTARIEHSTPADQARRLHDALALVAGAPFGDCGAWAHADGLVTATTALICDVAHRLAVLAMTFGDLDRATWALGRGLLVNPECELLHRDRMRVADAHGDHDALDAIMHDLRTGLEADGGWMSPETLQLYERLKRSSTITAAPSNEPDEQRHAS